MQVKENLDSTKDDDDKTKKSEALKTEEILSLLSYQNLTKRLMTDVKKINGTH